MANELKIRVVFDTGQAKANVDALTQSYTQFAGRVNAFPPALNNMVQPMQQVQKGSANMAMTMQAFNYTIRDSPYFFRDFSLGVLAVGNNLNPLIDGMIRTNIDAKAMGTTFGSVALQYLKGPQGVILAFSFLITIMQAVTFAMAKNKSGADDLAKSLDTIKSVISDLVEFENPFEKWKFPIKVEDIDKMITATDAEIKRLESISKIATSGAWAQSSMGRPGQFAGQELPRIGKTLTEEESKREKINEGLLEKLKEQKLTLEAQKLVSERLNELGITAESTEKDQKDAKEKSFIVADSQLKIEIALLEILKAQATSVRERLGYEDEIQKRRMELGAFSGLPTDELPGQFPGRFKPLGGFGKPLEDKDPIQKLREMKNPLEDAARLTKEETQQLSAMNSLATQVGNSLFQAFTQGGFAVDKFLTSLLAVAAQMVIIEGLKYLFTGGVSGIFGIRGFADGGVVGAAKGYVIPGQSSYGDHVPIMANSGEMVLNLSQQQNLLKLLSAPVSSYNQMMMGRMDAMNMNMTSGQPTILIQTDIDGLKFTKRTINPAQAKLIRGNVISVS